uniref:Uncharacterized protein n=1 Tax=Glycine max TaxID=3847 RepID=C6TBR5_SOYBN|nr:unknown [Glycine max]
MRECTVRAAPGRVLLHAHAQPPFSNLLNPIIPTKGIGVFKINEAALDSDTQQFFSGYMTRRGIEIGTVGVLVYVKSVKGVDINNVM